MLKNCQYWQFFKDGKWVRIQLEVDFIANLGSKKYYVQSALAAELKSFKQNMLHPLYCILIRFRASMSCPLSETPSKRMV